MSQIIEGIDNEITLGFILLSVAAAIGLPWYFRPRNNASRAEPDSSVRISRSNAADHGDATNTNTVSSPEERSHQGLAQENIDASGTGGSFSAPRNCNPNRNDDQTSNGRLDDDQTSNRAQENITVKVKFHESDKQVTVSKLMKLGHFKRYCFSAEVDEGKNVRFVFNGRILQGDNLTLEFLGLSNGCIVHAQISDHGQTSSSEMQHHSQPDLDISYLFVPSITFALILGWIAVFSYNEMFSTISIILLAMLSGLFILIAYVV